MLIEEMMKYRNILDEAGGGFDPDKILSYIDDVEEDGMSLVIPVNKEFTDGIFIDSVSMYVGMDDDMGGADGDLAVNYSITSDDLDPGDVMDQFYGNDLYTKELKRVLMQAGFSKENASNTGPSESGMQDYDRASYDTAVGRDVRKALSITDSEMGDKIGMLVLRTKGIKDLKDADAKKTDLIRWALNKVKEAGTIPFDVRMALNALQHAGIKWPEIDAITRSGG
jgi:hypothetical protein